MFGNHFHGSARHAIAATLHASLCAAMALAITTSQSVVAIADAGSATVPGGTPVVVKAGGVEAAIVLSASRSSGGRKLGVAVDFNIAPGWHIYGEPLPEGEGLTPTAIKFDSDLVAEQKLTLPKPTPRRFEALNETLPVYQGNFKAKGSLTLKQKLAVGDHTIAGTLNFQECNDAICKIPQSVHFEIPIRIEAAAPAAPKGKS
jgi:DsbC/DsbD-like thiol-disulfide interchange protein